MEKVKIDGKDRYFFEVPGKPQAKERPRLGRHGRVYTPSKTHSYENWIRLCFINKYPGFEPLQNPVFMHITVYKSIPKGTSKKKTEQMLQKIISPATKPDIDNLVKSIFDALNKIAYRDDSQICFLVVRKQYDFDDRVEVVFGEELD